MTSKNIKYAVLVTGAAGMIGRRLVPQLVKAGHDVLCVDQKVCMSLRGVEVKIGDLSDPHFCEIVVSDLKTLSQGGASAIIHLAGISNAAEAEINPESAKVINVDITENLLKAAVKKSVGKFLFASTGLVYGPGSVGPISEEATPNPNSVYAKTKLQAEKLVVKYSNQLSCEILRSSNVYGPDSTDATVLGKIIGQIRKRAPIEVLTLLPIRDFLFIDDAVMAFVKLLTLTDAVGCEITNVSSGTGMSIGEIVDVAKAMAGEKIEKPYVTKPEHKDRFVLANDKLSKRIGWRPQTSINEGLRLSLEYSK